MSRPARILHVPIDVGGHASGLAAAERALGYQSRCVSLHEPTHSSDAVEVYGSASPGGRERQRLRLLWEAMRWADEVHYHFGETLLMPRRWPLLRRGKPPSPMEWGVRLAARAVWARDVPLLRLMGRKIAFHFLGDDVRQRDFSLAHFPISIAAEVGETHYPPGTDALKRTFVRIADRHATAIFACNPDLLRVLPARARFVPYSHLDVSRAVLPPPSFASPGAPLRVVHAPTDAGVKGTRHVIAAVDALRAEGLPITLDIARDVSHAEAMTRIGGGDVFVDQLLAGWYGGAAVEAMLRARPVIAYLREEDFGPLDPAMRAALPVIPATPDSLPAVLRRVLLMAPDERRAIGEAGFAYARRFHDPAVAARIVSKAMGRS